jgi:hypothetical protein
MACDLNTIYDRTSGYCHICWRKVCFSNYGIVGARGAWEIEHSRPRARGGTNHGNNLYAACIPCNREKGHRRPTRTVRGWNSQKRAPLSRAKRAEAKQRQALTGAVLFGVAGSVFGPLGTVVGVALGVAFGNKQNPDRTS